MLFLSLNVKECAIYVYYSASYFAFRDAEDALTKENIDGVFREKNDMQTGCSKMLIRLCKWKWVLKN